MKVDNKVANQKFLHAKSLG